MRYEIIAAWKFLMKEYTGMTNMFSFNHYIKYEIYVMNMKNKDFNMNLCRQTSQHFIFVANNIGNVIFYGVKTGKSLKFNDFGKIWAPNLNFFVRNLQQ